MLLRCEIMGRTGEDTAEYCRSGKEGRQFSLENVFHGDSSLKLEIDEFLRVNPVPYAPQTAVTASRITQTAYRSQTVSSSFSRSRKTGHR